MAFMTIYFAVFVSILLLIYYTLPTKFRWISLLFASIGFYYAICREGIVIILSTALLSYFFAQLIHKIKNEKIRKTVFFCSVITAILPLLVIKEGNFLLSIMHHQNLDFITPVGISFYSLQIVAYLADVYMKKYEPENNVFRYILFVTYFPQIIQGPIPRFGELNSQLKQEYKLDEYRFSKGLMLVLWGCFLKLMIADKAAVIVDTVFGQPDFYRGSYVLIAGVLYSVQLYADFQACTCIARGVSELFGITLQENFDHPYFAQSVGEFWRRWHISLSQWLRDYIYIPLGGNRKGNFRKYINLGIVFLVSGMWHGAGYKYIFWGLLHAIYQVVGGLTKKLREKVRILIKLEKDDFLLVGIRRGITFLLVMLAWIIFRADSLLIGLDMLKSIIQVNNIWILFDDSIFALGLSWKECIVLLASVIFLAFVSKQQEKFCIRDKILSQNIITRWLIYIGAIAVIVVYGTYGFGFDAQDFIYGGF